VIDSQRSVHEATRAHAFAYYEKALTAWWTWRADYLLGQKFGERELKMVRGDLVRWLSDMVAMGYAEQGVLPWPIVVELSLDFCIVGVDRGHLPIRTPHTIGLDIVPLAERLAAYWMGER
jgi:hypothetical protein